MVLQDRLTRAVKEFNKYNSGVGRLESVATHRSFSGNYFSFNGQAIQLLADSIRNYKMIQHVQSYVVAERVGSEFNLRLFAAQICQDKNGSFHIGHTPAQIVGQSMADYLGIRIKENERK